MQTTRTHDGTRAAGQAGGRRRRGPGRKDKGAPDGPQKGPPAPGGRPWDAGAPKSPGIDKLAQREFAKFRLPPLRPRTPAELMPPPLEPAAPDTGPFAEIGRRVAAAKQQLDAIPPREFEPLMRALDLYRGLKAELHERCGVQAATNATLKMYELLGQMRLAACDAGPLPRLRAFCNAELPGAFLVAINHYARTLCPETTLEWLASSYYPGAAGADPTVLGDQYGLYAANRDRWLMGPRPNGLPAGEPDLSGDVTDADVVAALADAVHARYGGAPSGASLYTSDAGIDVSADYARQEELTALLNYGQVLCGLLALAPGGDLVTKQYTFVAPFSRSLLALVAALFEEAFLTKPLASRPVNSEVYVVGRGFLGLGRPLADALLDRLAAYRARARAPAPTTPCDWAPLLPPALYAGVDEALLRAARQLHDHQQVAFLDEAARLHGLYRGRLPELERLLRPAACRAQEAWLAANPVRRIPEQLMLAAAPAGQRRPPLPGQRRPPLPGQARRGHGAPRHGRGPKGAPPLSEGGPEPGSEGPAREPGDPEAP